MVTRPRETAVVPSNSPGETKQPRGNKCLYRQRQPGKRHEQANTANSVFQGVCRECVPPRWVFVEMVLSVKPCVQRRRVQRPVHCVKPDIVCQHVLCYMDEQHNLCQAERVRCIVIFKNNYLFVGNANCATPNAQQRPRRGMATRTDAMLVALI